MFLSRLASSSAFFLASSSLEGSVKSSSCLGDGSSGGGAVDLTQRKGNRQLLMDRKSPMHSVSNMMLTGLAPQNVRLQVDYHVYGNKINHQQVSLQQFIDYCKSEKCRLYFGTKTLTDTEITGTLFAYNEKYAYTHMLSVTIPLDILEGAQSQITGHAYVYIPLHDITEKYIRPIDF